MEIIAVLFAQIYHLGRFNENDFDLRLRFLVLCVSIWLDNISSSRGYEQVSLKENQKENKWDYLHERRSWDLKKGAFPPSRETYTFDHPLARQVFIACVFYIAMSTRVDSCHFSSVCVFTLPHQVGCRHHLVAKPKTCPDGDDLAAEHSSVFASHFETIFVSCVTFRFE